tara:strand:- start:34756 stop:36372 length:1617 start_codon:yes stop_codon:yes gene_type:complete
MKKLLGWSSVATLTLIMAACSPEAETAQEAETTSAAAEPGVVQTIFGALQGVVSEDGDYVSFQGVPFAAPPVGDLRWAPPAPPEAWEGVRAAAAFGAACAQTEPQPGALNYDPDAVFSEDCLYLNVYAPANAFEEGAEPLPVMFWIYGGGFSAGSASQGVYRDPSAYTERDVILVIPNYRLGALGYLAHPDFSANSESGVSGNYGTMDQIAALEWVAANIGQFGGDPENVTLFGESAGAISNNLLMVTPSAQDLFDKAIMQSGGIWGLTPYMKTLEEAENWGEDFLSGLGAETLEEARALDLDVLSQLPWEYAYSLQPIADGVLTPETTGDAFLTGQQSDQDIIIGWTREEAGRFFAGETTEEEVRAWFVEDFGDAGEALFEDWYEYTGDLNMAQVAAASGGIGQGSLVEAAVQLEKTPNVYVFRFDTAPPTEDGATYGAVHGVDVGYTFNYFPEPVEWRSSDYELSETLIDFWTNFAKTGDPNGEGLPAWPAYDPQTPEVMSFADPVQAIELTEFDLIMRSMGELDYSRNSDIRSEQ